jgi:hypothetical protein
MIRTYALQDAKVFLKAKNSLKVGILLHGLEEVICHRTAANDCQ